MPGGSPAALNRGRKGEARLEAGDYSHPASSLTPPTPPPHPRHPHQPRAELRAFWSWAVTAVTDAREEGVKNIFHLSAAPLYSLRVTLNGYGFI